MEKLITDLDIRQGEHRMPIGADLYWYIQKLQEIELMIDGVLNRQRNDLKQPLEDLCTIIMFRLEKDEERLGHRRSARMSIELK
jgi:hypothetical protein